MLFSWAWSLDSKDNGKWIIKIRVAWFQRSIIQSGYGKNTERKRIYKFFWLIPVSPIELSIRCSKAGTCLFFCVYHYNSNVFKDTKYIINDQKIVAEWMTNVTTIYRYISQENMQPYTCQTSLSLSILNWAQCPKQYSFNMKVFSPHHRQILTFKTHLPQGKPIIHLAFTNKPALEYSQKESSYSFKIYIH